MRRVLWLVVLACGVACARQEPVDLILTGAAVYTLEPSKPWAEAVAVRDGKIVAVDTAAAVAARYAAENTLNLDGMMVLPGFHDAHAHVLEGGVELAQCNLHGIPSIDALLAAIAACHEALPPDAWLIGGGWDYPLFAPDGNPKRELLDAIAGERPVALAAADGHATWVNSRALALAGVDASTPNPPNGIIERDMIGAPSGTLREAAAHLVDALIPGISPAAREAGLKRGLAIANGFGITSFIEARAEADIIAAYRALAARGELTARVVLSVSARDGARDALVDPTDRGSGDQVRLDSVKIHLDGVLEGETAALLAPYASGGVGQLKYSPEALRDMVVDFDARDIQVHVHAIGDRAAQVSLDAFAAARAVNGMRDNRHHIAHLQLIDPSDYPRFAALDVTANFQPLWAYPDSYITDINLPAVGQQRVERMYPIGSLQRTGARIVAGSDWSVTSMNPLLGIETAITRQDPGHEVTGVLNASESVSLEVVLAAYTRDVAWLMHQENEVGTIAPGKLADLVVLDRNLVDIPPSEISDAQVVMTLLAGETVFAR